MIDLGRIEGFDWDYGNSRKNIDKHGVSQVEAEQVFLDDRLLIAADEKHSNHEPRFHALGRTEQGRLVHATFTLRGEGRLLRVISARDMSRRERALYEQEA